MSPTEGEREYFAKVLRAYNILSDDEKRRNYDQFGVVDGADLQRQQQARDFFQGFGFWSFPSNPQYDIASSAPTLTTSLWKGRNSAVPWLRIDCRGTVRAAGFSLARLC